MAAKKKAPKKLYVLYSSDEDIEARISNKLKTLEDDAREWWEDGWGCDITIGEITPIKCLLAKGDAALPWKTEGCGS